MCGIAGQLARQPELTDLNAMLALLEHRGPDDRGVYAHENIQLGFRRLAIVDLSPAGHQPMSNEDGSIWLIFNGEVYNYQSLASELKMRGHCFQSRTDTETIIHAYEEWGYKCLNRFNGMFAFALWDNNRKRLFCARDRFGVKPFYYSWDHQTGSFVFASEIKALLQHPLTPRRANPQMIFDFLALSLLDHTSQTFFGGVVQLPAAHFVVVEHNRIDVHRYWDVPRSQVELNGSPTATQNVKWSADFHDLLEDSVRLRLQADVPVGTCLSGGLDSSSIVCLANALLFDGSQSLPWHERGQRQKTFSACYDDARYDERKFIDIVLAATGAEANFTFPGNSGSFDELIPQVVWHQDEPFGSTSIFAQWHVMRAAHERKVTVLLDGQGADELLGGYHGYFGAGLADDILGGNVAQFARDVQLYRRYHSAPWTQVGLTLVSGLLPPSSPAFMALRNAYRARQNAVRVLSQDFAGSRRVTNTWVERQNGRLNTLLYNQAAFSNMPGLLHYEDRNSMAFSIEARTPFLDYRIAEMLAPLPHTSFIRHGLTKVLLRDAMRGVIPEHIRTRLDKQGFSTPEDVWFRTSLRRWISDILHSPSLAQRGYTDPKRIIDLFERHVSGAINASTVIWRNVNVELWARMFLDPPRAPTGPGARRYEQ